VGRHFPRFFFPFLDLGRVGHNLDLPLIIAETHSATEALFVKISQTSLVIVMVSGSEQRSAQPVAGDVGEIPLDRLRLSDVDLVEVTLSKTKRVALQKMAIDRNRAVFTKLKKRNVRR